MRDVGEDLLLYSSDLTTVNLIRHVFLLYTVFSFRGSKWGEVVGPRHPLTPPPPGKSQVAICFLVGTGTDPHREAIGPLGC